MRFFTIASAAAALFAGAVTAADPSPTPTAQGVQQPSQSPVTKDPRVQGCWGSSAGLKLFNSSLEFNSRDKCGKETCQALGYNVAATYQGSQCWCGNVYPPKSALLPDKQCNIPCPGYGIDACGGPKAWTVYNTGLELYGVEFAPDASSSSSTSSPTSQPTQSVVDPAASQVSATPTNASNSNNGGGSNTAAIAAGVVIGLVALAGIAGGLWFWMRRRRNREIEEEHRRNAAVNAFIHGSKPGSSGGLSMTDSRMDPVMAQRRMSDGSIADNQDYSRRILRVTNA